MLPSPRRLDRLIRRRAGNEAEDAVARALARHAGNLPAYARDYLRRPLTPKQEEMLAGLDAPPYRVLARSANTQGKTFAAAAKCSHFFDTVRPSITLATAPTYVQVRDLLFKELRTLRPTSAGFLPKDTRLQAGWDHFVHGFTAATADSFQGRHAERLGLLFDEATGVDRGFWDRGETMFESHGGHWWLCTYNPNDSSSPAFAAEESGGWRVVVLSALDHPNITAELAGRPPPVPAAVRLDTLLRRLATDCERVAPGAELPTDFELPAGSGVFWRPLTPEFEAQILGRWPVQPTAALFSPALLDRCESALVDIDPGWPLQVGVDCARFGDDRTAIAVRAGRVLAHLETHSAVTTTWTAERVRQLLREFVPDADRARRVPVCVDDTGGYGAGVIDQAGGYNYVGVCLAAAGPDPRFPNTRTYLWCNLAHAAAAGGLALGRLTPGDRAALRRELAAARYTVDGRGRRRVEPKAQIKERLGRSPDRADAVALAYYLAPDL